MSKPVAVVTGGASGIGLASTKHLLGRGYRVVFADVNESEGQRLAEELGENALFYKVDVTEAQELAALFAKAFQWGGNRLDFLHANAGIDDRQSILEPNDQAVLDENGLLQPMNMKTLQVDLEAVFQCIWQFKYYARQNQVKGAKILCTASQAGLYAMHTNPMYTAAKYGVVGLVRAAGQGFAEEKITLNCVCPGYVQTNITPPEIHAIFPKKYVTPMATIMKAVDTCIDSDVTGQVIEASLDKLTFRKQPDYVDEAVEWMSTEKSAEFWAKAYATVTKPKNGI